MAAANGRDLRVAVIGLGPRGIYAIERLIAHARFRGATRRVRIDAFDPAAPGAGDAFDPEQPDYLRLNVNAGAVDAWYRHGTAPSEPPAPTFDEWRPPTGEASAFDTFPPRRMIGQYLACVWTDLQHRLPAGWKLTHQVRRVTAASPTDEGRWLIRGGAYDEVLLTAGVAGVREKGLRQGWAGEQPLVDSVHPATVKLSERQVPPGASVAFRGAGHAFLDAVLTLTEGRDGTFTPGKRAHRMRYRRSGRDVAVVYPFSRTGRFPEVRPSPDLIPERLGLAELRNRRLARLASSVADPTSMLALIADAAAEYLRRGLTLAGQEISAAEAARRIEEAWGLYGRSATEAGLDPRRELERSVRVAFGERPVGPPWAIGRAWRDLYPAMTEVLAAAGTASGDAWDRFRSVAAVMDKVANGTASLNGVKLLALIDGGVVDPRSMVGGPSIDTDGIHWPATLVMPRPSIDIVVDAVAPPGYGGLRRELMDRLVAGGHLRIVPGGIGVDVLPDCQAIGRTGSRTPGLSVLGRPGEYAGGDALLRQPEDASDRWAERLASDWF